MRRLDKKPDRVEISEEQLVQATMRAEELAAEVGRPLRVVGWYHSHPHITVWPSHVGKEDSFIMLLVVVPRLRPQDISYSFPGYL